MQRPCRCGVGRAAWLSSRMSKGGWRLAADGLEPACSEASYDATDVFRVTPVQVHPSQSAGGAGVQHFCQSQARAARELLLLVQAYPWTLANAATARHVTNLDSCLHKTARPWWSPWRAPSPLDVSSFWKSDLGKHNLRQTYESLSDDDMWCGRNSVGRWPSQALNKNNWCTLGADFFTIISHRT